MNAIELLELQHGEVLTLLDLLGESEPGLERKEDFDLLRSALLAHMAIEEDVFYPAVVAAQPEGEAVAEGYEEHATARVELERCQRALGDDQLFKIRIRLLREMIEHHLEEERGEILPLARESMSMDALDRLGAELETRFFDEMRRDPTRRLDEASTEREQAALHA